MPDAAEAARASGTPASRPALPARAVALLREAIVGELAGGLLGPRGPYLAAVVTLAYVAAAAAFVADDVAVSFAILPLVLAALTMSASQGLAVVLVTGATVLVSHAVVDTHALSALEVVELLAFGFVSLALRLVVVRLSRGRAEIDRVAADLGAMRAQVDEARESTERWVAQLEVAQRAAARMAGRASVRDVAETVADEIRAIVDYHACRVYVLEEPDELVPIVSAGDNGYETILLEDLGLKMGEGFSGWVAANGRPLLVPDANADPRGVTIPGPTMPRW